MHQQDNGRTKVEVQYSSITAAAAEEEADHVALN